LGPTAVGKTEAALQLASHFQTCIISADSRQCFRELNIGVAKPSAGILQSIPHYFINSHSVIEQVNAAIFETLAQRWVSEIFKFNKTAVMVGGTGLYIQAFCEGLDEIPLVDSSVREAIQGKYRQFGLEWLKEETRKNDPEFFAQTEKQNPQRLMRALEVKIFTDRSILSFRTQLGKTRPFEIVKIGLQLSKEELNRNINARTDSMMEQGLLKEVSDLSSHRHLNALRTVGYTELFDFLDGKTTLEESIERIKLNTRHYAKRQITWFAKDKSIHWISPGDWKLLKKITQS
jgi:tRNA dimethylallyltransferase